MSFDDENPDPRDLATPDHVQCVHCGHAIHADAQMCPRCEMWQTAPRSHSRKPLWFVVTAVILILVLTVIWVLR